MTISDETLAALRERYTSPKIPPCRVCGAALGIASMGGGAATVWACGDRPHEGVTADEWYDHYGASRFTQTRYGDPDVLELINEFETMRQQRGQLAVALQHVLYDLHPVYPSTSGPYGGVGGSAMTPWCHVNDPYTNDHQGMKDDADRTLHDVMGTWTQEEIDAINERAREMHETIERLTE